MKKINYLNIILVVLLAAGCAQESTDEHAHEADVHDHNEEEANTEDVHLLKSQMDVMEIELGQFKQINLSSTVKANGKLELPPQNKASVSTLIGGRVQRINVIQGQYVNKGQVLAMLEHLDVVKIQQDYMASIGELSFKKRNYERKKSLLADSITSAKSFQEAESVYLSALALTNGLKANLELLGMNLTKVEQGKFTTSISVRSPINGYVRSTAINMGQFVQPQQEMFQVEDNDHIHIDLMVYEKDMRKVKKGQKVVFSLSNSSDSIFQGTIFAVGKAFEKTTKTMIVHAEIDNKTGDLLPGMYVDARIITNQNKVKALPEDALVSDGGLNYIFVLKPASLKNHAGEFVFRKIEVNLGDSDIGYTEVVPVYNLPNHVQVVTKGAFYLLAEMKKGEGGHGHHH